MEKSNLRVIRVTDSEAVEFKAAWELYKGSFPIIEQRTLEHQRKALENKHCYFDCYFDGDKFVGFICYWLFEDYMYIEHYAINPEMRCMGYGGKILNNLIGRYNKVIILEIEPVVDDITHRRLTFYQRLGFKVTSHDHTIPEYQLGMGQPKMVVLSHPTIIDEKLYEKFNHELYTIVMAR